MTKAVGNETAIIISGLTEIEALVKLKAAHLGGTFSLAMYRRLECRLSNIRNEEPFVFRPAPNGVWEIALGQHRNSEQTHCRTLDRLHLAIMEKLGLTRLMTHDIAQAKAAKALNFEVLEPGR